MNQNLIYDVGVHNGDDTAYYIHKGYKVVGIEANPEAVTTLKRRFATEIASGTLRLLEAGIAEREGELDFYICNESSDWSSFDPNKAATGGKTNRVVKVRTVKFSSILEEYGVPYYCKIDIEENDGLCLQGVDPRDRPEYLSIEMSHTHADRDIAKLKEIGYRRFKILSQSNFALANARIDGFARKLPDAMMWRMRRMEGRLRGKTNDKSWKFNMGSSGPFGDDLPGRWITFDSTIALWHSLCDLDKKHFGSNWFDIHAAS